MPHIHEKIDFTASVFITNGDAVLLRKHEKYHKWLPAGGHIELDEDPNQAALREAKEETGLDITLMGRAEDVPFEDKSLFFKNLVLPSFMNIHAVGNKGPHQHIDFVYFAIAPTRTLAPREEEKANEMRWFTAEELEDPTLDLWPSTKYYAKAALEALTKK